MTVDEIVLRIKAHLGLKIKLSLILTAGFGIVYLLLQRHLVFSVTVMKASRIDSLIPFVPGMVYLYQSLWFLMPIAPWLMESKDELIRYSRGVILTSLAGFCVFFFFPTAILRLENYGDSNLVFSILTRIDNELNAFPSLHAALAFFHGACCHRLFSGKVPAKRLRWFLWIWVLGVVASTLFTKQHVLVDIVAGMILGLGSFFISWRAGTMIRELFFPGLLDTGPVDDGLLAVRDGYVNFFVVKGTDGLICVDTGWSDSRSGRAFAKLGLDRRDVKAVFLTHLHGDHARCPGLYPEAEVFTGEYEKPSFFVKRLKASRSRVKVKDGQMVTVCGLSVRVIDTPGHTAGSVSYLIDERWLFTGDALRLRKGEVFPFPACFNNSNRTHRDSIRKLARLDTIERLLTGHTGASSDVAGAFHRWRRPSPGMPNREDST